jgi:hypothetical protein
MAPWYDKHYTLPAAYKSFDAEQLLAEVPYVWQPSVRLDMLDMAIFRAAEAGAKGNSDSMSRVRALGRCCLMPPTVAQRADGWINWGSPAVVRMMHARDKNVQESFETEILHISDGTPGQRSYITNSGFTMSGHYPIENVAAALQTSPERLTEHLLRYTGESALLAQTGSYFTQISTRIAGKDAVEVGNTWKLTKAGVDVVEMLLGVLEQTLPAPR